MSVAGGWPDHVSVAGGGLYPLPHKLPTHSFHDEPPSPWVGELGVPTVASSVTSGSTKSSAIPRGNLREIGSNLRSGSEFTITKTPSEKANSQDVQSLVATPAMTYVS